MRCDKCRTKAFKIIAGTFGKFLNNQTTHTHTNHKNTCLMKKQHTFSGVTSVRLEREQGKLVVEGEQVEIAVLAQTLTKKVGRTEIVHVSEY